MKLQELIKYSKIIVKNNIINIMIICILPLIPEIFFRFTEATIYSLILYFNDINPISLFQCDNTLQIIISIFSFILRWITISPLMYVSAFRLCEICYDNRRKNFTPISQILINGRNFRRSLIASLWIKIIGTLSLIPAGLSGITAYYFIMNTDNLFMFIQSVVLTIIFIFLWINIRIALFSIPFLMAHFPNKSVFKIVLYSFKFMNGRYTNILKIFIAYSLPIITIICSPYFLSELMTAFALSISIYVREDDYSERIKINRRFNKSFNTPKISHRKRRFTSFTDKTQASGFGNNL